MRLPSENSTSACFQVAIVRKISPKHQADLVHHNGPAKVHLPPRIDCQLRPPGLVGPHAMMSVAGHPVDRIAGREVEEVAGNAVGGCVGEDREIGPRLIAGIQREIAITAALLPGQGANGHAMRIAGESSPARMRCPSPAPRGRMESRTAEFLTMDLARRAGTRA